MPPRKAKEEKPGSAAPKNFMALLGKQGIGLARPATTGRNMGILPTGNLPFDIVTGRGGLKGGTITIVTGDAGVGKSSLCYRAAAQAQAQGMGILLWDTENRYQPDIAEANGLDPQEHLPEEERTVGIIQWSPYVGTELSDDEAILHGNLQEVQAAVRIFFTSEPVKSKGGLFIIDSVNFQRMQEQEQGEDDKKKRANEEDGDLSSAGEGGGIALLARMMHGWMPELLGYIHRPNNYCIMTRQKRTKIQKMAYGSNVAFSGGKAIEYSVSFDAVMDKVGKIKPDPEEEKAGFERHGDYIKITVRKNTAGFNNMTAIYEMTSLHGIDDIAAVLLYGISCGLVEKSGGWYKFQRSNGEWSKPMYAKDLQNYFWENEENLGELYGLMNNIRLYYARIPKRREIIAHDSTGDTPQESEGQHSEGEPEPVSPDAD